LTGWLQAEVERLADTPQRRALAIFDALHVWFRRPDFDCCALIAEHDGLAGETAPDCEDGNGLGVTVTMLEGYASQAGASDPQEAGRQLQLLMMGAIVSAGRGDDEAARHARSLAELVLDGSRQ
jgi:hypothetical protein